MSKVKINNSLAALVLVCGIFTGWQTLLLAVVLMLIFCEVDDKLKNLMVTVVAFVAGIALITLFWNIIYEGINLFLRLIEEGIGVINAYLTDPIDTLDLRTKFINPVTTIIKFANSGFDYLVLLTKFGFIISVLTGRAMKENAFTRKVNEYIIKVGNFSNNFAKSEVRNDNNNQNNMNNNNMNNNNMNNNMPNNYKPMNNDYNNMNDNFPNNRY